MKRFFLLTILFASATNLACSQKSEQKTAQNQTTGYENINASEFKTIIQQNNPDVVILDVRTPQEYNSGHIDGAENIDFYEQSFKTQLAKLDTSKTYLVYCRTGRRSAITANMMSKELGFPNVKNMTGGIVTWNR